MLPSFLRRSPLSAAILTCWLFAPTFFAIWLSLQDGASVTRILAMLAFASCVYALPLTLLGRVRSLFILWLPAGLLAPLQCYLIYFFRSVPGDALMDSVLHVSVGQVIEMASGFGWLPLLLPLTWIGYVVLLRRIDPAFGLSIERRKILAVILLPYILAGVLWDPTLGHADKVPPLFDSAVTNSTFPASVAVSLAHVLLEDPDERTKYISLAASAPSTPQIVILVIGESLRADHLGVNGYARHTTPGLAKLGDSLLSFTNVASTANYTSFAVPRIVSRKLGPDRVSLVSMFKEAGFRTAWLSNQEEMVFSADAHQNQFAETSWKLGVRYDTELLPQLRACLRQCGDRQFIVLHILGSHFPYESRYDPRYRVFTPTFGDTGFPTVSARFKQHLINSYDNTVVATDRFLSDVIAQADAERKPAVVMFTADHGENLYDDERQFVLHSGARPSRADTFVPLLVWANQAYRTTQPDKLAALRASLHAPVSHLDIMPTLLDMAHVSYTGKQETQSLASPAFRPTPRKVTQQYGLTSDVDTLR
jgi:glucan phosphoethanolaminetransferase (alkaline phosphatase superfamily)